MDAIDNLTKISNSKQGFFKHVFDFGNDSKEEIMNIIQYAVLAIIPVVIFNKFLQKFVPEADETKSSIEISLEIVIQVMVMFLGILFIHRIITYIPTWSEEKYQKLDITNFILIGLMIILSLTTKIGEKVSILTERITELWSGKSRPPSSTDKKTTTTPPISSFQPPPPPQMHITPDQHAISQSLSNVTQPPTTYDFNSMYQQNNAQGQPAQQFMSAANEGDIQPANSVIGGGFGSTW